MGTLLVRGARLATMTGAQAAPGLAPLGLIEDGAVLCDGERIAWLGPAADAPAADAAIDAGGALLTPGLVDPHTHLLFGGDRAHEHALRLAGATYLEIARQGGGIRSTVGATRAASDEALLAAARARLARLVRAGVTTVEVKTGYGLSVAEELRMLRLISALHSEACEVVPTLLALHAVPPDLDRAAWVRACIDELLPQAAGARAVDVFCEQGAFTPDECRSVLRAGLARGLIGRMHADQLTAGGGAQLAAELGCASADHLERTDAAGAEAMARAGVCAVLLPLAAFFLRDTAARAEPFLRAGVTVALGSNLNPGSQRMEGTSLLLAAGCLLAGLTPAQALWAMTSGASRALRLDDRGALRAGLRADLVLFATRDPLHLAYHAGVEHAALVVRSGRVVHDARGAPLGC